MPTPLALFSVPRAQAEAIRGEFRHYYKFLKGFCNLRKPTTGSEYMVASSGEVHDAQACLMRIPRYAQTVHIKQPYKTILNEDVFFTLICNDNRPQDKADCDDYYLATVMLLDWVRSRGLSAYTMDPWPWGNVGGNFAVHIPAVKAELDRFVFLRARKTPQKTLQKA